MYIEQLKEMVPPPSQNTVAVSKENILLILYNISSRLVTLLKINDAPTKVSDLIYLTVGVKFINFIFQIFLPFVPEMSTSFKSYIV
jgi:hypothetical protein